MSKVLIAIDGSENAKGAVDWYLSDLHRKEDEVLLIHVMQFPYVPVQPPASGELIGEILKRAKHEGQTVTEKYKNIMESHGITPRIISDFGEVGAFIVKVAQTEKASFIVMGCRGMGSIRRTILGSVSDYILHHAHCPVCIHRH